MGAKARLVELAQGNARHVYNNYFNAEERQIELSKELAKLFGLTQVPRRIECLDISNFQASDMVAGLVSFFDGQLISVTTRNII